MKFHKDRTNNKKHFKNCIRSAQLNNICSIFFLLYLSLENYNALCRIYFLCSMNCYGRTKKDCVLKTRVYCIIYSVVQYPEMGMVLILKIKNRDF